MLFTTVVLLAFVACAAAVSEVCVHPSHQNVFFKVESQTGERETVEAKKGEQTCLDPGVILNSQTGELIVVHVGRKQILEYEYDGDTDAVLYNCSRTGCKKDEYGPTSSMNEIFKVNTKDDGKFSGKLGVDFSLLEGDILVDEKAKKRIQDMKDGKESGKLDAQVRGKWPKRGRYAYVPYTFNSRFNSRGRQAVQAAIRDYGRKTCVKFVPRTNQRNYIEFFHGGGCYSYIGVRGGRQQVSLAYGCLNHGTVVHEMMHAIGFYHEQSRRDRDRYITVYFNNIIPRTRFNFEKYRSGAATTHGFPYDKKSVMHYPNNAFSSNGRWTIVSKSNPREILGQRRGFSPIDVKQINAHYKCSGGTTTTGGGGKKPEPPPPSGCRDTHAFCPDLKNRWCSNTWVRTNCKKSCGRCGSSCKDKNKNCASWASRYCNDDKYKSYMKSNCQKSCNLC